MYRQPIYAIYDIKAESFIQILPFDNDALATRAFEIVVNTEGSDYNVHPEDYTLLVLGEWNRELGELTNYQANRPIASALSLWKKPTPQNENT